jgi:membrane-bound lytic murein transglycosylase C
MDRGLCPAGGLGYPTGMPVQKKSRRALALLAALPLTLAACSTRQAIDIAMSGDPEHAITHLAAYKAQRYKQNPLELVRDIRDARRQFNKLVSLLKGEVSKKWGSDEVLTPSNKRYVKYTQNYKSRAIVEFDAGRVTVETLDQRAPGRSLRNAIVTTLLTPDDPRAVDLYSARTVKLSGRPYLYGLVEDRHGHAIDSPARAEAFADELLKQPAQVRQVRTAQGKKTVRYVRIPMVNDYENRQAKRYAPLVDRYARRYSVSKSLVFAVIKTESSFNPFAVSTAPAYGLMQLVPATGGRDAYRRIKGYDHTPSKEYLFIADNNIQLGTAYLGIIDHDYLGAIHNPVSREYCTIAAYNGGAGNVLRVFSPDRDKAVQVINRLSPAQVYRRLREQHPRAETRRYLVKVLDARREFVNI